MEQDQFGQTRSKWLLIHRHKELHLSHTDVAYTVTAWPPRRIVPSGHRFPLSDGQIPLLM